MCRLGRVLQDWQRTHPIDITGRPSMNITGISGSLSIGLGAAATGGSPTGSVMGDIAAPSETGTAANAGVPIAADGTVLAQGGAILTPTVPPTLSSLMELMQGFSTAELLIAMMMAAGSSEDEEKSGSAALGLLAGLAMAGQTLPQMDLQWQVSVTGSYADASGGLGGGLDVSV